MEHHRRPARRWIPSLSIGTTFALLLGLAACEGGGRRDPTFGMMDPATEATFSSIQSTILSPSCARVGCHTGAAPAQGLDLSEGVAFGNLVGVPSTEQPIFLRVEPGNVADSYLFMKVSGDARIQGVRMPLGLPPLSATQLDAIALWIDRGAPND